MCKGEPRRTDLLLSRVRMLQRLSVLQPFSPFLFQQGPPKGPARLLRLWKKEATNEEILEEWLEDGDSEDDGVNANAGGDIMKRKLFCASCYFAGNTTYSHPVQNFDIASRSDMWSKYVAQGAWTRCVKCIHQYGPIERKSNGDAVSVAGRACTRE